MKENMNIENYDSVLNWSYSLASQWVKKNLVPKGIVSARKFEAYKREGGYLPLHFPKIPDEYFKRRSSWKGWRDFFGNPVISRRKRCLSYRDASRIAKMHNIKNCKEYRDWKDRPANMPARPGITYKGEWKGWREFLGNCYQRPRKRNYSKLSESDVRIIKHQLDLGITGAALAKIFQVSEMQISRIRSGENWGDV